MRQSRAMRLGRKLAMTVVTGAVLLVTLVCAVPANARTLESWGSPGSVHEDNYYIHCNYTSTPSLWVEGVQTWASPAYIGTQKVGAWVDLYKLTSSGWSKVGYYPLGSSWTHPATGSISFGPANWSLGGHGYYTAYVRVQWLNQYGGLLGQRTIIPNQPYDFTASYAWAGNPASCYA
jgi:hypothetical protein